MEILEEKIDRECHDNATKLFLKTMGEGLFAALSDDDFEDQDNLSLSLNETDKNKNVTGLEVPLTWEPMTGEEVSDFFVIDYVMLEGIVYSCFYCN